MTPAIRLSRAVVLLGRFPALAGADLVVEPGEIVHLTGPNGAGKTTLLRTCAALHRLAAGDGEVLGVDLAAGAGERRRLRRRLGLLGHGGFLYDDLSVEENVRFAVAAAGGGDRRDAVLDALESLGLAGRLRDVPVALLSSGQRRRTALAVLAARRPELWLLDEPHAGLDADGRDLVDRLVRDAAAAGATVVLASHEVERAAALAPRRLVVAGGEVHEVDGTRGGPGAAGVAVAAPVATGA